MKISMKDYEEVVNIITNQIIFINTLGEYEYHPEREDFLIDYFYLKLIKGSEFSVDYSFEDDIFSLEFYEDLAKEIDKFMTATDYKTMQTNIDIARIKNSVDKKVEFIKQNSIKKTNFGLTDTYLAELVAKLTYWLEDKGIEEFLKVVSKTGEELGNKELQGTEQGTE